MNRPIHSALLSSKPPDQAKTVWLNAPKMLSQTHRSYSPGSLWKSETSFRGFFKTLLRGRTQESTTHVVGRGSPHHAKESPHKWEEIEQPVEMQGCQPSNPPSQVSNILNDGLASVCQLRLSKKKKKKRGWPGLLPSSRIQAWNKKIMCSGKHRITWTCFRNPKKLVLVYKSELKLHLTKMGKRTYKDF